MLVIDPGGQRLPQGRRAANGRPYSLPLAPSARGLRPQAVWGENCTAARNISGYGKVLSLRPFGAPPSQMKVSVSKNIDFAI